MRTKKLLSLALVASLVLSPSVVCAQDADRPTLQIPNAPDPVPGEPDVGSAVSPMKRGQTAPFTGVLMSPRAVAFLVTELANVDKRVAIERDRAVQELAARDEFKLQELKIRSEADVKILNAQLIERDQRINILTNELKRETTTSSSSTPSPVWITVGVGAGFFLGVALSGLTVFAVSRAAR